MTYHRAYRRRRRRAFTLVEVLIALVLFGIVIGVTMSGIDLATRAAAHTRSLAEAATLGEARLAQIVAQGDWASAAQRGDFGGDFPGYQWSLQTTQRDTDLTEIVLSVTWNERGQERSVNLSTLAYAGAGVTQ